jgi:hypothetical protein
MNWKYSKLVCFVWDLIKPLNSIYLLCYSSGTLKLGRKRYIRTYVLACVHACISVVCVCMFACMRVCTQYKILSWHTTIMCLPLITGPLFMQCLYVPLGVAIDQRSVCWECLQTSRMWWGEGARKIRVSALHHSSWLVENLPPLLEHSMLWCLDPTKTPSGKILSIALHPAGRYVSRYLFSPVSQHTRSKLNGHKDADISSLWEAREWF